MEPEPLSDVTGLISRVELPMKVVGFDAKVAAANGFSGQPASPAEGIPTSVDPGNCGFSYVELYDVGVRKYRMDTGFGVAGSAISYTWSVRVTSSGYLRNFGYSGGLFFRSSWTNSPDPVASIPQAGNVAAYVQTGRVTLSNGSICETVHPASIIFVD